MKCNQEKSQWAHVVVPFCLFILIASYVAAQEPSAKGTDETEEGRNKLAIFFGNTQDDSENGVSTGLEYEYLWSKLIGVGAMVEYAGGDIDGWVVGIPFFLHPYAGWFVLLMPGLGYEEDETGFVFRTGVGYDFDISAHWSLAPEFNAEFPEEGDSKLIYGFTISRKF